MLTAPRSARHGTVFSSLTGPYGLIIETVLKPPAWAVQPAKRTDDTRPSGRPLAPGLAYRNKKKAYNYNTLRPVTVHG